MNQSATPPPSLEHAWNLRRNGDPDGAVSELEQVLERAEARNDHRTAVRALVCQAYLAQDRDEIAQAVERARLALNHFEGDDLDDPELQAYVCRHLGDFQRRAGRSDEALGTYKRALGIYRALDDEESLDFANTVRGYALALEGVDREEEAIDQWRIAAEVYGDIGVPGGMDEAKARIVGDRQDLENQKASGA